MDEKDANIQDIPNSQDSPDPPTFEQATARIDEIVRLLERGDAPLEKSLTMFEEGAKLINMCSKMLDEAEQKIVLLQRSADGGHEELAFSEGD